MKNLFPLILLLAACCDESVPKTTSTICPDGDKCIIVDCHNDYFTHADCVVAFGKACSTGYEIKENNNWNSSGVYLLKCHDKTY
jgi:hypothetical protein